MKKLTLLFSSFVLMIMMSSVFANSTFNEVKKDIDDSAITTEVKGLLLKDQLLNSAGYNALKVHVETINGVVLLTGEVKTEQQKEKAEEVAKSVGGVKGIFNKLDIK